MRIARPRLFRDWKWRAECASKGVQQQEETELALGETCKTHLADTGKKKKKPKQILVPFSYMMVCIAMPVWSTGWVIGC